KPEFVKVFKIELTVVLDSALSPSNGFWQRPTTLMANDQRPTTEGGASRIAYLDCFSGISGDMFLGALIDAGVSPEIFEQAVAALNLGAKLEIARVNRSGISATKVDVVVNGQKDRHRESH